MARKSWREIALAQGDAVLTGTGGWPRRVAEALNLTEGARSASWSRRIAEGNLTASNWEQSARKAVEDA